MRKKSASMSKIAELANVSAMTVSRVLNNSPAVLPETREKVLQIARQLGYEHYPNALSRMLRGERSKSIGILACFARPNLTGEVLCRIGRELFPTNYVSYIVDTYSDPVVTLQALKTLAERRTEGVIHFSFSSQELNEDIVTLLEKIGASVVITHEKFNIPFAQIYCGWTPGVDEVVKYFKKKNSKCPVLLKESTNASCHLAFETACKKYGFSNWEIVSCPVEKLDSCPELKNGIPGDAIFASSEKYHPALELMTDCGRKLPMVMLMDDFLITHIRPEYPVLRRKEPEAGVLAVKMLFDQINNKPFAQLAAELPMEFIENINTIL